MNRIIFLFVLTIRSELRKGLSEIDRLMFASLGILINPFERDRL